ncbi:MAG: GNVR domain-containing protein, partial [Gammaproteobacteria bacterium]|nr:GNVR domain-containing protein [Gammaproteobacteria bacterium]
IYLESELAQVNPNTELYSETGERILGLPDRIKVLKSKLAGATALYGEEHPSVIRLKKELDGLKETTSADNATTYSSKINELEAELGQMRKKYSESHPDILRINREIKSLKKIEKDAIQDESSEVVPQNPIYLKLQVEIEATNSEMTALLEKQEKLNIRYNEYETRLAKTPQIEREFRVLTRDYESAWAKYRELKAKQMEARIAAALEVESKGERFTLIDPPQLPEEPIKPNRLVIVILGFILSTVSAFGLTIILETMDSTIRGRKTVASIMGLPPLATIPYIKNPADSRKKFVLSSVIVLTVFLVVGMSAWMVHLYYKPLDVLWYVALKRIGLTA